MHPFSPALTAEVERKVAMMRLAEPDHVHAAELERALRRPWRAAEIATEDRGVGPEASYAARAARRQ